MAKKITFSLLASAGVAGKSGISSFPLGLVRTAQHLSHKHRCIVEALTGSNNETGELNVFPSREIEEGDQGYGLMEVLELCLPTEWNSGGGKEMLKDLGFNIAEDVLHVYVTEVIRRSKEPCMQSAESTIPSPDPKLPTENDDTKEPRRIKNALENGKEVMCFSHPCRPPYRLAC